MIPNKRKMMKNEYNIHGQISYFFASKLNKYINKEGIEKIKLEYGMEILLRNITKLLIIFFLAVVFNIVLESIIVMFSYNIIRSKAYGIHASSYITCLIWSIIVFIICVNLVQDIQIDTRIFIICLVGFTILLGIYAPADTEKRPIIGENIRRILKIKSVVSVVLLMIIGLLVSAHLRILIVLGVMIEVLLILPITYKILGKEMKNYEKYEGKKYST